MFIVKQEKPKEKIIKISFSDEKRANRLFQKLLFYNKFIEKPRIKNLETNDLLFYHESTFFYHELNIIMISKTYKWYTTNYKVTQKIICHNSRLVNQALKIYLQTY